MDAQCFQRLRWSCALAVWSVMESLVGSLRLLGGSARVGLQRF
jgi:hypothetical protein